MIKSITLKNFQSHKDSQLEFSPGVNAIVGSSDSGKTAIIRGLRWLVWNRPLGDAFRSTWGGDTIVDVSVSEGRIQRVKTNRDNMYVLGDHNEFKAAGTDVPEELRTLLNLDEVNLQQQLDRPFLLDDSPGAVAEHFNRIAHLDNIDLAVSTVQKWIRQTEQDMKAAENQSVEYKQDLETYSYLPAFECAIADLEQEEQQGQEWKSKAVSLSGILTEIDNLSVEINTHTVLLRGADLVDSLLEMYTQVKESQQRKAQLENLLSQITTVEGDIRNVKSLLPAEMQVGMLLALLDERKALSKQNNELRSLLGNLDSSNKLIKEEKQRKDRLEKEFSKLMPNICPLCGGKVKR